MPSKAKRMLISVGCYQFSLFSLSPQNYKSVVPTALFIPSFTAGHNYAQEANRGTYFGSSQETSGGSILQGRWSTTDYGGALWPQGPLWGLCTEPPLVPLTTTTTMACEDYPNQDKEVGRGDLEKDRWKKGRKCKATLFALRLSFFLHTALKCFCNSRHHISGHKKMSHLWNFYLPARAAKIQRWPFRVHFILVCLHSRSRKPNQH